MYLLDVSIRYLKYFCVLFVLIVLFVYAVSFVAMLHLHLWWFYSFFSFVLPLFSSIFLPFFRCGSPLPALPHPGGSHNLPFYVDDPIQAKWKEIFLKINSLFQGRVSRSYRLHVPKHWPLENNQPLPLLLDFHGWTQHAGFVELKEKKQKRLILNSQPATRKTGTTSLLWLTRMSSGASWSSHQRAWLMLENVSRKKHFNQVISPSY